MSQSTRDTSTRELSRRARGLSPLPISTTVPPPAQPNNNSQISTSHPPSSTDSIRSLPLQSHTSVQSHSHTFPNVSDASSSQYNSAMYPPDDRNPYLQNNFPPLMTASHTRHVPSSMSTISSYSHPHTHISHVQPPFLQPLINAPSHDDQILNQLRLTIDNLNNVINTLRDDLMSKHNSTRLIKITNVSNKTYFS